MASLSECPDLCQHPQRQHYQRRPALHPWRLRRLIAIGSDAQQSLTVDPQSRGSGFVDGRSRRVFFCVRVVLPAGLACDGMPTYTRFEWCS